MGAKLLVLGGWGVSPDAVRARLKKARPDTDITASPPTRTALAAALATPVDTELFGWSLGARLLLDAALAGKIAPDRRLTLVCPFLAFPKEAGQGGLVSATQVKFLRRHLAKDPLAALADFYQRAGLDLPAPVALPYSAGELDEGLALLADPTPVTWPPAYEFPPATRLLAGANDPLLDNTTLSGFLPGLRILPGAGHDLADFLPEITAAG